MCNIDLDFDGHTNERDIYWELEWMGDGDDDDEFDEFDDEDEDDDDEFDEFDEFDDEFGDDEDE